MVKVLVVGGSIGGLSSAVALMREGCEVVVLERAARIVPAGAGLGLDPVTCGMMNELGFTEKFKEISRPIPVEEYRWVDSNRPLAERRATSLIVNADHLHRSLHWSDLHKMLFDSLPQGTVNFAHKVMSYEQSEDSVTVIAQATDAAGKTQEVKFTGDYLVAADGSNSTIRRLMLPEDRRRYAGMIAWRGVVKGDEHPELLQRLKADFGNLDRGIVFDLSPSKCMNLIYLLPGNRINWLWYRDAPEPDLVGYSVTVQATPQDIAKLHRDAEATWTESFVELIKTTEKPFINAIFDKEPLESWTDGRVVLLGEAAHPTTPHGSRSTNMSLQDSFTLGRCFGKQKSTSALKDFEKARIPQTSQEVLFSRYVGELRQGRWIDPASFDWPAKPDSTKALLLNAKRSELDYRASALAELKHHTNNLTANGHTISVQ